MNGDYFHNTDMNDPLGEWKPARWGGGQAILFFIVAAALSVLLSVLFIEGLGFYVSIVIAEVLAFAVTPWLLSHVFDLDWSRWFAMPRIPAAFWGWGLAAVLGFAVVQSNVPVALDRLYPMPIEHIEIYRQYLSADSPFEFLMFILVAAVVPAFCEEIAFRGAIQTGLKRTFGARNAIIWTGFLFALLHLNPWNFPGLWAFGCLLGYLTERTGSIRPAILAHLLNNSLALVVFALQTPEDWESSLEFVPWYWTVLAGVIFVYAILRLNRISTTLDGSPRSEYDPGHSEFEL